MDWLKRLFGRKDTPKTQSVSPGPTERTLVRDASVRQTGSLSDPMALDLFDSRAVEAARANLPEIEPRLLAIAERGDFQKRFRAGRVLQDLGSPKGWPLVLDALNHGDFQHKT